MKVQDGHTRSDANALSTMPDPRPAQRGSSRRDLLRRHGHGQRRASLHPPLQGAAERRDALTLTERG